MKNLFFILCLVLTSNFTFSQKYTVIIIKEPETLYDFAKDMGNMQSQAQKKYDYNHARISNAMNSISDQIFNLNYPYNLRENIIYGWKQIINEIESCSGGNVMLSNSSVNNIISIMTSSINKVISNEVKLYNGSRTYNNYNFKFCNNKTSNNNYKTVEFGQLGESKLNYNFSFGVGLGLNSKSNNKENVNSIITSVRLGKKTTIDNLFEKFSPNNQNNIPEDKFNQQFAITSIYNYHTSLFSESLFIVTGAGASYSKIYTENEFKSGINPVINLGIDYNFNKIPLSIGFYNRLNFGDFSSFGFSTKILIK